MLSLAPKFLSNLYDTHFRSLTLYGIVLTNKEHQPLLQIDELLVKSFLKGLLKLKSKSIPVKHCKRILLILRIPTSEMKIDKRCLSRVSTWAKRSSDVDEKIVFHAKQSIGDVKQLEEYHPLRRALERLEAGGSVKQLKEEQ